MLLAIALSTVLDIDIEWSSTYKGHTYGPVATHIVRNGNDFVLNGAPISADAVQALIDALEAPAMSEPTLEGLHLGSDALDSIEPAAMQTCNGVSATQAAQDVYRERFTDVAAFATFLHTYYAKPPPNAAVPTLRIVVTTSGGPLAAVSTSSKAGMLPFTVTRGDTSIATYNAALSAAVDALLPASLPARLLRMDSLNDEWAVTVCDDDMTDLAFRDALPQTQAFAQKHGLTVHGWVHGNPIDLISVSVWGADTPRITMHYSTGAGGDVASVMALRNNSNVLHRVAILPWLQHVLAKNPNAVVSVDDPSMNGNFLEGFEVQELRRAGFGQAASLLASNLATAQGFWVWLKPDKESTQWYLLANGDALLVHYLPAEERLPFDAQMNERIHRRGVPFDKTPTITVGAIVTPDGTLEP